LKADRNKFVLSASLEAFAYDAADLPTAYVNYSTVAIGRPSMQVEHFSRYLCLGHVRSADSRHRSVRIDQHEQMICGETDLQLQMIEIDQAPHRS